MFTSTPLADLSYTIPSFVILEVTCDWPDLYHKCHGLSTTQQNLASTRMWRSLHAVSMNPMHNKGGPFGTEAPRSPKIFPNDAQARTFLGLLWGGGNA